MIAASIVSSLADLSEASYLNFREIGLNGLQGSNLKALILRSIDASDSLPESRVDEFIKNWRVVAHHYMDGGSGNDHLWGDFGDDHMFGDADTDYAFGGAGDDHKINGSAGHDHGLNHVNRRRRKRLTPLCRFAACTKSRGGAWRA